MLDLRPVLYKIISMSDVLKGAPRDAYHLTSERSPEQNLWIAVLYRFVKDAVTARENFVGSMNGKRARHLGIMQNYVNAAKSQWMNHICELAGQNHDTLIKTIKGITSGNKIVDVPYNRIDNIKKMKNRYNIE